MIKSITSVKVTGRRVIVRAGFDVPVENGEVMDETRIKDCLPTLSYLIGQKAKIVIISHLGRPDGWDKSKSLLPVAKKLAEFLNYKFVEVTDRVPQYAVPHVCFLSKDITKNNESDWSKKIAAGSILFLENMRFYSGEGENDDGFLKILTEFGDVYVNEAFSVAHRKEVSTFGLAQKLPAYAGIDFLKEITALNRIINHPTPPFVLMVGGAKIKDKIATINNLAKYASQIIVGGAVANAFLAAQGYEIGQSKVSDIPLAKELLRHYKNKIVLPIDLVASTGLDGAPVLVRLESVGTQQQILDIGPKSISNYAAIIKQGKTLVWNGPFGLFENPKFAFGSKALAQVFATRSKGPAFGVIGGGETIEVFNRAKVSHFVDHISTGGSAMLEFLAGKQLPAIRALDK